jgi:hypothetical protein
VEEPGYHLGIFFRKTEKSHESSQEFFLILIYIIVVVTLVLIMCNLFIVCVVLFAVSFDRGDILCDVCCLCVVSYCITTATG